MNMQKSFVVRAGLAGLAAVALVACGGAAPEESAPVSEAAPAEAAAPAVDAGIQNVSILHLNVESMDDSLAFYRDVLGMQVIRDNGGPSPTPIVPEDGAMMHTAVVETPGGGFSMELVEVSGIEVRPQHPNIQDPGEMMLAMNVADQAGMLAGAKRLGLDVLSAGGEPVVTEGRGGGINSAVMVHDPSGFVVELTQNNDPDPNTPISNVSMFLTAADLDQTVAFYNNVFGMGMDAPGTANPTSERVMNLFDNHDLATMRTARGTFPGTDVTLTFQEFTGVEQHPVRHRVQDPGGPIFTMGVTDFAATMDRVKANGGTIGDGAESVMLEPDATFSWIRDPNGLLIRVSQAQPPQEN